ncbi:MAG: DUF86 domain-containing protein [Nitrospirae bacterium]|nr:DUF86 domain-containing protein [Nitrospirota bacterium]
MTPEARDPAHLWDMQEAARTILQYTDGFSLDAYLKDGKTRSAVERQLEILGEAARRVSETFKQAHPKIPWQRIIAQRNVLAHEYGAIEHFIIWNLVITHIPALIAAIEPLMPPLPPETP